MLGFPGDPQTWYRLAAFQLGTLEPARSGARRPCSGALYLDPFCELGARRSSSRRARASASSRRCGLARKRRASAGSSSEPYRVAIASSVPPERRRSEADLEPELADSRRSERRVKSRRCGESGLGGRTSAGCAGVVSASGPLGCNPAPALRQDQLHVAHVFDRLGAQNEIEAPSPRPVGPARARARPSRACGSPRRARASATARHVGERSAPRRRDLLKRPSPPPRSSARSHPPRARARTPPARLGGGPPSSGMSSHSSSSYRLPLAQPRAISISVWPNGAARGREPSRSSRWMRALHRRGRRRHP